MKPEDVLKASLCALQSWDEGLSLDEILDDQRRTQERQLRRAVESLLFYYFRHKGLIDGLIQRLSKGAPKPELRRILCVSLTQGLFQTGVPREIAVSVAVDHAKRAGGRHAAGYVNAVARKGVASPPGELLAKLSDQPSATIPAGLLRRWRQRLGAERTAELAGLLRSRAPLTVRVVGPEGGMLDSTGFEPCGAWPWSGGFRFYSADSDGLRGAGEGSHSDGARSEDPGGAPLKEMFEGGSVYAQDPATALAPGMLRLSGTETVVDLCAAPGGKTLMLSELVPEGFVLAFDRSPRRMSLVAENVSRFSISNIRLAVADGIAPPLRSGTVGCLLLDAPCSNTGVARRRPDALWRFTEDKLKGLVKLQATLLQSAAALLKPGGRLVYSTCSMEPEENELQVRDFLVKNPAFKLLQETQLHPCPEHDGAYAALLGR